jgi:protein disulfide-isomerase
MKHLLALTIGLFLAGQLAAAEGSWLTDLPKAQAQAKADKKHVLLDFTGSDWCPPCISLHKNVFSKPEFEKFAKDRLVLVELDFPRAKPQSDDLKAANKALQQKYEIKGYPTVIVLDADGKEVFKKVGYGGQDAAKYIAELETALKK